MGVYVCAKERERESPRARKRERERERRGGGEGMREAWEGERKVECVCVNVYVWTRVMRIVARGEPIETRRFPRIDTLKLSICRFATVEFVNPTNRNFPDPRKKTCVLI